MFCSTSVFSGITISLAPFDRFPFVVEFFTTAEGDDEFDVVTSGQEFGRDDAHAGFFAGGELVDLAAAGRDRRGRHELRGQSGRCRRPDRQTIRNQTARDG